MSIVAEDVRDLITELEAIEYHLEQGDFQTAHDELENQQGTVSTIASHVEELL